MALHEHVPTLHAREDYSPRQVPLPTPKISLLRFMRSSGFPSVCYHTKQVMACTVEGNVLRTARYRQMQTRLSTAAEHSGAAISRMATRSALLNLELELD